MQQNNKSLIPLLQNKFLDWITVIGVSLLAGWALGLTLVGGITIGDHTIGAPVCDTQSTEER